MQVRVKRCPCPEKVVCPERSGKVWESGRSCRCLPSSLRGDILACSCLQLVHAGFSKISQGMIHALRACIKISQAFPTRPALMHHLGLMAPSITARLSPNDYCPRHQSLKLPSFRPICQPPVPGPFVSWACPFRPCRGSFPMLLQGIWVTELPSSLCRH